MTFDRENLLQQVRAQMTEHRFIHTLGVASTAEALAKQYGADPEEADLAGILHDYCKFWEREKMEEIIQREESISAVLLLYDKELWHAPVGAYIVERDLGITNQNVLDAIRYHTSGRKNMTLLEKILWVADYIEPGRQFPGVDEIRELAHQNLNEALLKALGNTLMFLIKQKKRIYPLTVEAYNGMLADLQETR
ncbi:bis(5'-nucleosyl)-tetraphosphatase (symmetrical) YqeK [Ammoniphilus resinae]|uniref:bis(5'-nucleosyl)-tetraphosphatase (symmetrical) n=1 Tax=Ammoniphilus resinae TaxID=861532 RepID=A0ABS4GJU3_9BACL|nr:bis(5'-nucleosyl)-tetraphosphatase (symmetrical) YqeK [Ammoniphilus resinae]MBP1930484.1 putative HD superfamily hydrolase involved in NAD metabolism [Ammoniphilus resinae]